MTILAGVGAGLALLQQQDQADAVNKRAYDQGVNINKSTVDSYAQLNRQGIEDAQNNTVDQNKIRQETAARLATARTAAAGSGVAGLSVDSLLMTLSGKGMEAGTTSDINYLRTQQARADQGANLTNRATSELNSIQTAPGVGFGDVVGAGLKVGAAHYTSKAAEKAALRKGN